MDYKWPGNVAELESTIGRAMRRAKDDYISSDDLKRAMQAKIDEKSSRWPDAPEKNLYEIVKHLATLNLDWCKVAYKAPEAKRAVTANFLDVIANYLVAAATSEADTDAGAAKLISVREQTLHQRKGDITQAIAGAVLMS
jgi:DNA-binding NtrC family response regulator